MRLYGWFVLLFLALLLLVSCDFTFHKMLDNAEEIGNEDELYDIVYVVSNKVSVEMFNIVEEQLVYQNSTEVPGGVRDIAVHAGNNNLYSVSPTMLYAYEINEEGLLENGNSLSIALDSAWPVRLDISSNGSSLFVANAPDVYSFLLSGTEIEIRNTIEDITENNDLFPFVHPDRSHLYVNDRERIRSFAIDSSGALGGEESNYVVEATAQMIIHPNQLTMYLLTPGSSQGDIRSYRLNSNGVIISESVAVDDPINFDEGLPLDLAIHSSGSYLYVSVSNGTVRVYAISADGTVASEPIQTVNTLESVNSLHYFSGETHFLLASCPEENSLVLWRVGSDGQLTRVDLYTGISNPSTIKTIPRR
ncbi:MAG: hypothetical protein PF637_05310 [Spirochaetes bacterium]|jgi:6-phosphogluconolactonase (cycloisomerase 2 family)|nr:hypothetical protein [Spirochaetota bacterium]